MMPLLVSALSGVLWAGVAYALGARAMGWIIWGGIAAAPLIGVAAGPVSRGFDRQRWLWRVVTALVSLYVATALFGLAAGLFDIVVGTNSGPGWSRIPSAVVLQSMVGFLCGLTVTGYFLVLWPLAYLTHTVVARFWRDSLG